MGALLYSRDPQEEDYRGERFRNHPEPLKNCTEALVLTQPRLIEEIHRAYLEAGADIIETCTFNGTPLALASSSWKSTSPRSTGTAAETGPPRRRRVHAAQSRQAALRGRQHRADQQDAVHRAEPSSRPGPRDVTFDDFVANYYEQIEALVAGGVDICCRETGIDILVLKACLFAIDKYLRATRGMRLPVMVSGTIFDERPHPLGPDARGVLRLGGALRRAERRL